MLTLASDAFPNDPLIKLQRAQLASELGEKEQALELLNKIRNLEWSEYYYPQMPQYLTDLTTFAQAGAGATESAEDKSESAVKSALPIKEKE